MKSGKFVFKKRITFFQNRDLGSADRRAACILQKFDSRFLHEKVRMETKPICTGAEFEVFMHVVSGFAA